jgi:tetratricopeptide (TPR) repeat protein
LTHYLHPEVATNLGELAGFYVSAQNYQSAAYAMQEVLRIRRAAFGSRHQNTLEAMHYLAWIYRTLGNYTAAIPLLHEALELTREIQEENHPDIATELIGLADIYRTLGNFMIAETLYVWTKSKQKVAKVARGSVMG